MTDNIASKMQLGGSGLNALFGKNAMTVQDNMIRDIPLSQIKPNAANPYKVEDENAPSMQELVESIKNNGVQTPALVRPLDDGTYELVSGHRRFKASGLAGKETLPCVVRRLDDDSAIIALVDANHQRVISPMERARAYQIKLDALRRLGKDERAAFTQSYYDNLENNGEQENEPGKAPIAPVTAREATAENFGVSPSQVQRFVRLNKLTPELQERVDTGELAVNAGAELSYLQPEEQKAVEEHIAKTGTAPTIEQAKQLRKLSQDTPEDESINAEDISKTIKPRAESETGKPKEKKKAEPKPNNVVTFTVAELSAYFPADEYSPNDMKLKILELVQEWSDNEEK